VTPALIHWLPHRRHRPACGERVEYHATTKREQVTCAACVGLPGFLERPMVHLSRRAPAMGVGEFMPACGSRATRWASSDDMARVTCQNCLRRRAT
jgi:hypothetical protein